MKSFNVTYEGKNFPVIVRPLKGYAGSNEAILTVKEETSLEDLHKISTNWKLSLNAIKGGISHTRIDASLPPYIKDMRVLHKTVPLPPWGIAGTEVVVNLDPRIFSKATRNDIKKASDSSGLLCSFHEETSHNSREDAIIRKKVY